MNIERLYLDYNATSPLSYSVTNWLRSGDLFFANPAGQYQSSKFCRKMINEDRLSIYQIFHQSENQTKLFFHSGATEAIHTLAHSFSEITRLKGQDLLICYSNLDHSAVVSLGEKFLGAHVKYIELKRKKDLTYDWDYNFTQLKDKKDHNPNLVILYHHLWMHNETGHIAPLKDLSRLQTIPDLYIHVDAVQAPGKVEEWEHLTHGDIWSFSSHKFGALKGMGFTFMKKDLPYRALFTGGNQQEGLRSGTENALGIRSVSLALKDLLKVDVKKMSLQRSRLVTFLKSHLKDQGGVIEDDLMGSNTIYFYLHHHPSDVSLALFDLQGIEISSGAACSSGAAKPSSVLLHRGLTSYARNGLRLSLPFGMEEEYLEKIQARLGEVLEKLIRRH